MTTAQPPESPPPGHDPAWDRPIMTGYIAEGPPLGGDGLPPPRTGDYELDGLIRAYRAGQLDDEGIRLLAETLDGAGYPPPPLDRDQVVTAGPMPGTPGATAPADVTTRWLTQEHARRVAELGESLIADFESLAYQAAAELQVRRPDIAASRITGLMIDAHQIGRGQRDPLTRQRTNSIIAAWHRAVCGCLQNVCRQRDGITKFVEGS